MTPIVETSFRGLDATDDLEAKIRKEVDKLGRFDGSLTRCRVAVEVPHKHHHRGNLYHVRIDAHVPGAEIVVTRTPHGHESNENVTTAIRQAFDSARRRLEDHAKQRAGQAKTHAERPQGRVVTLVPDQGFGFLMTSDGREIYFHEHSVLEGEFASLVTGSVVAFLEEEGEKGPQASTVRLVARTAPEG